MVGPTSTHFENVDSREIQMFPMWKSFLERDFHRDDSYNVLDSGIGGPDKIKYLTFPAFHFFVGRLLKIHGFFNVQFGNPSGCTVKTVSKGSGPPLPIAWYNYTSFSMAGVCSGVLFYRKHFIFLNTLDFKMLVSTLCMMLFGDFYRQSSSLGIRRKPTEYKVSAFP